MTDAIRVEGDEELARGLRRAAGDLEDMAREDAQAAAVLAAVGRTRAPHKSGGLRASIGVQASGSGAEVVATAVYAPPIHWGWPARNIAAQPFLTTAGDATQGQREAVYAASIQATINKIHGA